MLRLEGKVALVFDRYGDPDVMSLRDVPVPEPQDGEVIRVCGC
jgi:NADPH:quinone reductase-like Zn-dependent oxidoreductase